MIPFAVTIDWVALSTSVIIIIIGVIYAIFGTRDDGGAGLIGRIRARDQDSSFHDDDPGSGT